MPDCVTVACWDVDPYPVALAVTTAVPTPWGTKDVEFDEFPPLMTTGEEEIVPTAAFELVTLTVTDWPPATSCSWTAAPEAGSNWYVYMVIVALG
jgi:hypothetical protein